MPQALIWHTLFDAHDAGSFLPASPCFACLFPFSAGMTLEPMMLMHEILQSLSPVSSTTITLYLNSAINKRKIMRITKLVKHSSRVYQKHILFVGTYCWHTHGVESASRPGQDQASHSLV